MASLAEAITLAPRASAICTATAPTPPAPPSTNSVSPALTSSRRSPRSPVSPATPAAAATAQSIDGGLAAQESSTAYSAWVLLAAAEHVIAHGDAGDPLADLVDHTGGVIAEVPGAGHRLAAGQHPENVFQSIGFTLAARTAIRICPGPACGSGASAHSRTSGPPYALNCNARIHHSRPGQLSPG